MKHVAQAYTDELKEILRNKQGAAVSPVEWGYKHYLILGTVECELQINAKKWNALSPSERLGLLRGAHKAGFKLYKLAEEKCEITRVSELKKLCNEVHNGVLKREMVDITLV